MEGTTHLLLSVGSLVISGVPEEGKKVDGESARASRRERQGDRREEKESRAHMIPAFYRSWEWRKHREVSSLVFHVQAYI